jgi:hypothetical protein
MPPRIVHASSKSLIDTLRRVLHIEYAGTHGHGGLSRSRDGSIVKNRSKFLPDLRSATLKALSPRPLPGDRAKLFSTVDCGLTQWFLEGD